MDHRNFANKSSMFVNSEKTQKKTINTGRQFYLFVWTFFHKFYFIDIDSERIKFHNEASQGHYKHSQACK